MTDDKTVRECVEIVRETISNLMSDAALTADQRVLFLNKVQDLTEEYLKELAED